MNRDKVRGLFVGGAVGDAWGMPVETWPPEKILEVHPNGLDGYKAPIGHKWFTDDPKCEDDAKTYMEPGYTTDDTQLTRATAKGLITGRGFDMDEIAKFHVVAMRSSIAGWGKTTVEACRRLSNGVNWKESGKTTNAHRGTGNGIPMKCGPLAAFRATAAGSGLGDEYYRRLVDYSAMTHYTQMSAQAGIVHCEAILNCLYSNARSFSIKDWMNIVCNEVWNGVFESQADLFNHLNKNDDNLEREFIKLWDAHASNELINWDRDKIIEEFGGGSCYVLHSLPFTYAFFYKHWKEGLGVGYQLVHAGGDTDTNAKIALELIGALHGMEIFERPENRWTIEGLSNYDSILSMADQFCDTFGVA